jgi:ubiquinone biosynthesis protein COQ4
VRRLIADKEDTAQVFEIMRALSGNAIPKGYRRLLSTPEGGRIAYERDEFAERLSDPAWLAQFGPGTVGAAYRDFIAPRGLSAEGLAEESRKVPRPMSTPPTPGLVRPPHARRARRLARADRLRHRRPGRGLRGGLLLRPDPQPGLRGHRPGRRAPVPEGRVGQPYGKAVREAWRNGRAAAWLPAVDYPALFALPLDEARRTYKVAPNSVYQAIPPDYRDRFHHGRRALRQGVGSRRPA